jgi:hypothetical protein
MDNDRRINIITKAILFTLLVMVLSYVGLVVYVSLEEKQPETQLNIRNKQVQNDYKDTLVNIVDIRRMFSDLSVDNEYLYITIAEKGFDQVYTNKSHWKNIFGFSYNGSDLLRFPSVDSCIRYFNVWLAMSPRKEKETLIEFLKRRKWNPNPEYYEYFKQVMMVPKYRSFVESCS